MSSRRTPPAAAPPIDGRTLRRIDAMRRIQSAALELFRTDGFESVSVKAIAARAGVGPATVYRAFGTKDRIVLWDEYDPMLLAAIERKLEKHAAVEAVRRAVDETLVDVYERDRTRIARRVRLIAAHPALMAATSADRDGLRRALATLFVEKGAAPDELGAEIAAGAIVATLEAAVQEWARGKTREPLTDVMRRAFARLRRLGRD